MIIVNEYRKVGNSYVDTGDEYSVFSTDSILCAKAVSTEQSDIFMVYTTGGMFVTDLAGINLFGSELISINLYRKNFNIIKATGIPIRVNAKKVVTTYSAEPGYEIDGITPVTCIKIRLVNGFLIITDEAGVSNLSVGSTRNMQLNFKQGSIGEKVSFRKESGSNPNADKDIIIPGLLEITRGNGGGGIYNIAQEGSYHDVSPLYTSWNTQYVDPANTSWASLGNIQDRTYDTWRDAIITPSGNNAPPQYVGMPVVMKYDNGLDEPRYWLIMFTEWGVGNNNEYGFAYDRYEILPAVEFSQPSADNTNTPNVIDIISEGVHITRSYEGGQIYNVVNEPYANSGVSPRNTKWNSSFTDSRTDYSGFQDLSNLESRVYTDFYNALDGDEDNTIGTELIMHDMTTDLYYKVEFDTLSTACPDTSGPGGITNFNVINFGSGYPNGTYGIDGTGGSGEFSQFYINVVGGIPTSVTTTGGGSGGRDYQLGDIVTIEYSGVTDPVTIEVTEICSSGSYSYTRTVIPQSCGIKFADGTVMNTAVTAGGAAGTQMNYVTGTLDPEVESDFISLPDTITMDNGDLLKTYKLGGIATFDAPGTSAYSYLIGVISGDQRLRLINDASVIGADVNTYDQVSGKFAVNAYVSDQASGNIIPLSFATIVLDNTIASPNDYFVSIVATAGASWKGTAYIDIEFMSNQVLSYFN